MRKGKFTPIVDELFPHAVIDDTAPTLGDALLCVGQPYPLDLEGSDKLKSMEFSLVHTSRGTYESLARGEPNDNFDLGKMEHSCWTYWGHSVSEEEEEEENTNNTP